MLSLLSFCATISACEKGRQVALSLNLLQDIILRLLVQSVVSCNGASSACEKGKQWELAVALLCSMAYQSLMPGAVSFNVMLCAHFEAHFEARPHFEVPLRLLQQMAHLVLTWNELRCNAAITACERGK